MVPHSSRCLFLKTGRSPWIVMGDILFPPHCPFHIHLVQYPVIPIFSVSVLSPHPPCISVHGMPVGALSQVLISSWLIGVLASCLHPALCRPQHPACLLACHAFSCSLPLSQHCFSLTPLSLHVLCLLSEMLFFYLDHPSKLSCHIPNLKPSLLCTSLAHLLLLGKIFSYTRLCLPELLLVCELTEGK